MQRSSRLADVLGIAIPPLAAVRTRWQVRSLERRFPAQGTRIRCAAGPRIHVVVSGPHPASEPSGDVVLVHGAFGGAADWEAGVGERLRQRGLRTFAVDRPGHGHSDRGREIDACPAGQARALRSACARLGVKHPLVVGFSLGGAVALAWALSAGEESTVPRGLALINAATHPWGTGHDRAYDLLAAPVIGALFAHTIGYGLVRGRAPAAAARGFAPCPVPGRYLESGALQLSMRPGNLRANARDVRGLDAFLARQSAHYERLRVATLLLTSTDDGVVSAQRHSDRLQADMGGSARHEHLDGAGHQVLWSHPTEVARHLLRFGASLPGTVP